ncbi:MerR family transcriptional regulator [Pseudomonas sp. LFM046]|uniref:MerR family transcriptional regulator n=1 Tax=Pseudomonas sp. LFM046 TaxID=1608357 RepID=UPI0005CFD122|nr:MerR family transcriptional regulator [Pseudomonas sp. LFM046]
MDSTTEGPRENDYQAALARGLLPIREVARQTGVNPVTLRAWERRYGLVAPLRTSKGHRLYTADEVARIRLILTWLDRGVAVGQVKGLLTVPSAPSPIGASPWAEQHRYLLDAIGKLAERQLDEGFNTAMALYPPLTVYRQLLHPLLEDLEQRWRVRFGAQVERVFFLSWLRTKLGARIYHNNRQCSGAPILLVNASERTMEPGLWITAWLASSAECNVEVLDGPLPAAELALAVAHIQPRALLLYSSQPIISGQLSRLLNGHPCPCLLAGPVAAIHPDELKPGAILAAGPLDALQALAHLGLMHNR